MIVNDNEVARVVGVVRVVKGMGSLSRSWSEEGVVCFEVEVV